MSTEIDRSGPRRLPDDIFDLPGEGDEYDIEQLVAKINQLETALSDAKDQRREERFYWIAASVAACNFLGAGILQNTTLSIVFIVISLMVLAGLARYCGVDWAVDAMERVLKWMSDHMPWKREK